MRLIALALMGSLLAAPVPDSQAAMHEQTLPTRGESATPGDLEQMAQEFNAAVVSRDMDRIMRFYSDRYLHNGRTKEGHRGFIHTWIYATSRFDLKITRFAAITDDHAYIEAVIDGSFGTQNKDFDYQVVRENGQWKWLGNQKS